MGDERRINQLTAKAYDNIGSSDYFAVDNASEAESKKLPASSIKTPISNLQGEVTGGSDTYSSTKNYSVGMYATHTTGGVQKLYRCKTACTAASWTTNASCFEEANLADAVSALNNDLNQLLEWQFVTHYAFTGNGTSRKNIDITKYKELLLVVHIGSNQQYNIIGTFISIPQQDIVRYIFNTYSNTSYHVNGEIKIIDITSSSFDIVVTGYAVTGYSEGMSVTIYGR